MQRLLLSLSTCLLSCGPAGQVRTDNVIRETAPFQQFRDSYNNGTRAILIERARHFGEQNDFEVAVNEFGVEGFSILLTRPDMNLAIVHSAFGAAPLEIDGFVRGAATVGHGQMLARLRAYLARSIAHQR